MKFADILWPLGLNWTDLSANVILPARASYDLVLHRAEAAGANATEGPQQPPSCWAQLARDLSLGCEGMSHPDKQRLALRFANCHLVESARPAVECAEADSVRECLAGIREDLVFDVYTQFWISVDSSCFYLASEGWRETVAGLIRQLAEASHHAHEIMLRRQEEASQTHASLAERLRGLSGLIDMVASGYRYAENAARLSTGAAYALCYALLAYLLTCTARTSSLRYWMYCCIGVEVLCEAALQHWPYLWARTCIFYLTLLSVTARAASRAQFAKTDDFIERMNRRDLQLACKKYSIPANSTNAVMRVRLRQALGP